MAYSIAVEKEKDIAYNFINIKRCRPSFTANYSYEDPYECSLKEIDNISTIYKNEEEFKEALTSVFALPIDLVDKPLVIVCTEGIKRRFVEGHLLYEESRNLIENETNVIKYIEEKYRENDYTFFRQLAENLKSNSIGKCIISHIASVIEERVINGLEKTNEVNQNTDNDITTSAKILVYKNDIDEKGNVRPTRRVDYEALHNLVSFISDYEHSLSKDKNSNYQRTKQK